MPLIIKFRVMLETIFVSHDYFTILTYRSKLSLGSDVMVCPVISVLCDN
jgi:hypothetical protein